MVRVLELQFVTEANKNVLLHVTNPKIDVTAAQAKVVGDLVVSTGVLFAKSGKIVKYMKAQFRSSEVVAIA